MTEMDSIYKKIDKTDLGEIGLTAEMIGIDESSDKVDRSVFEQVMWERDVALNQLKELGYGLGEKPKTKHCKDCKWWKDSDGLYRRGGHAESQCPINRREVFEGNGYCYMYEPQESEDK